MTDEEADEIKKELFDLQTRLDLLEMRQKQWIAKMKEKKIV